MRGGVRWTRAEVSSAPPSRTVHALADDPVRKCVVLYGGTVDKDAGDIWEWDGTRRHEGGDDRHQGKTIGYLRSHRNAACMNS
jgi:hypothetical protein